MEDDVEPDDSRELLPARRDALSVAIAQHSLSPESKYRDLIAFWLLGLLNNTSYVIMIAGKSLKQLCGHIAFD